MRKLTLSILAAALVVASAPAFADQPTGAPAPKYKQRQRFKGKRWRCKCVEDHPERPIRQWELRLWDWSDDRSRYTSGRRARSDRFSGSRRQV